MINSNYKPLILAHFLDCSNNRTKHEFPLLFPSWHCWCVVSSRSFPPSLGQVWQFFICHLRLSMSPRNLTLSLLFTFIGFTFIFSSCLQDPNPSIVIPASSTIRIWRTGTSFHHAVPSVWSVTVPVKCGWIPNCSLSQKLAIFCCFPKTCRYFSIWVLANVHH